MKLFLETTKEIHNSGSSQGDIFLGQITKSKVEEAFKQKITTRQIMKFLNNHAHKDTLYRNQSLEDKMETLTVKPKPGEQSVSHKFGLSSNATEGSLRSVT